jgi:hypothetical protein
LKILPCRNPCCRVLVKKGIFFEMAEDISRFVLELQISGKQNPCGFFGDDRNSYPLSGIQPWFLGQLAA